MLESPPHASINSGAEAMRTGGLGRHALLAVAGLLLLALTGWAAMPEARLALFDEHGHLLVHTKAPLTIRYLHSVARTAVEEDFYASPRGVGVSTTRFGGFGAGLPSQPEWDGSFSAPPGEPFRVDRMDIVLPSVTFRVGYVSDQTLVLGERLVRLDALASPGSAVSLHVISQPRLVWWLHERYP